MEELIKKLSAQYNLSNEQVHSILQTITGYVKEKFPMVSGAIDNLFQSGTTPSGPGTTPADVNSPVDSSSASSTEDQANSTVSKLEQLAKESFSSFFGNKK